MAFPVAPGRQDGVHPVPIDPGEAVEISLDSELTPTPRCHLAKTKSYIVEKHITVMYRNPLKGADGWQLQHTER